MPIPALPNPVRVSPTIKLARWTCLVLGIMYGSSRHNSLAKKEAILREIEERERPAKEAAEKAEKDRIYQREVDYLRTIGVDLGGGSGSSAGGKSGGGGDSGSGGAGDKADTQKCYKF